MKLNMNPAAAEILLRTKMRFDRMEIAISQEVLRAKPRKLRLTELKKERDLLKADLTEILGV